MKLIYLFISCCIISLSTVAQPLPDAVKTKFNAAKNSSDKGKLLISFFERNTDNDSILKILLALRQYFEENKEPAIADYVSMGICRQLSRSTQYVEALKELFRILPRVEQRNDRYGMMVCNRHFSYAYYAAADSGKTLHYDRKTLDLSVEIGDKYDIAVACNNLGADLAEYGHFDSTFFYSRKAVALSKETNNKQLISKTLSTMAESHLAYGAYDSAYRYIMQSIALSAIHSQGDYVYGLNDLAQLYLAKNRTDSAIHYATLAIPVAHKIKLINQELRAYQYLQAIYEKKGPVDSAYKYLHLTILTKDSLFDREKTRQVQLITAREQTRQRETEQEKMNLRNKIKMYALVSGMIAVAMIGLILYRNSKREKSARVLLQQKNDVIQETLHELKSTQSQLIQAEKMASLGELTAGIAHEIQNPLNFVNNFSELNKEMVSELVEEADKGNTEEVKLLATDIRENSEKIHQHGKRADAIVKGMLQHSRKSEGQKEPTDINALCDEYLRLSYHGLRAKDKSFNATLKTDFDDTISKVNIIPQDTGRVIMNLLTNAFYAVNKRSKHGNHKPGDISYQPTVKVVTKKLPGKIEINVIDNGDGIPADLINKIFQPFFTTKPTGEGTGLGLSLSYDIIRSQGGELKVETKEGEGSNFIISLPTTLS